MPDEARSPRVFPDACGGEQPTGPTLLVHPGILFLAGLLGPLALHLVVPLGLLESTLLFRLTVGGLLFAIALTIVLCSIRELRKFDTAIEPAHAAARLVRTGPYRFSRNPMYLSQLVFLSSVGLLFATAWPLVAMPIVLLTLRFGVVEPEERYLETEFRSEYRDYRTHVRRWI